MSFLGGKTTQKIKKQIISSVPILSAIDTGLTFLKNVGIIGEHSHYTFNPYHPPGEWRGAEARKSWEAKRIRRGYGAYTQAEGAAFKAYQKGGGTVQGYRGPGYREGALRMHSTSGERTKESTTMPGGSNLMAGTEAPYWYPLASGGWGTKSSGVATGGKRRRAARGQRKRKRGGRKGKARAGRKLRFGSPAWRKKYLGKKKRAK